MSIHVDERPATVAPHHWTVAEVLGEDVDFTTSARKFIHHVGTPGRFAGVMPWTDLNQLLHDQALTSPRMSLRKARQLIPEDEYTSLVQAPHENGEFRQIDVAGLLGHLRDGASLVISLIDRVHPGIRALRQDLERELQVGIAVHLYVGCGRTPSFGLHFDQHDVIALQLHGEKDWTLHPPTRTWPMLNGLEDVEDPPMDGQEIKLTLVEGSALFIPRGWWHHVTPNGDLSMNIAMLLERPYGLDFLQWAAGRAALDADAVRQDVPPPGHGSQSYVDSLRAAVNRYLTVEAFEQFHLAKDSEALLDSLPSLQVLRAGLPDVRSSSEVRLLATRFAVTNTDAGPHLRIGGQGWQFPPGAAPVIARLTTGDPVPLADVLAWVPQDQVVEMVRAGHVALR